MPRLRLRIASWVIDLFSRHAVGWSMRPDVKCNLVIDALETAWHQRRPDEKARLIFHSDRGSQYASDAQQCAYGASNHAVDESQRQLLGQRLSETLFGSLKVERLRAQRFQTVRRAKDETIAWLLWHYQTGMHSTLHYVSPIQFEQNWNRVMTEIAA